MTIFPENSENLRFPQARPRESRCRGEMTDKDFNVLNDLKDFKVFNDFFGITLAYSYLWLRLRYSASAKSK